MNITARGILYKCHLWDLSSRGSRRWNIYETGQAE